MNKPGVYKLFVYGSLRSGFKSQAYEYISRFFSFDGDARVKGKLFDMGPYPAAVPASDGFIVGELYTINNESEFGWAIGQLDDYEGVSVEPDEIQLFKRELVEVFIENATTSAWIYWYNGSVEGKPVIESGDLIQYLQQKK
jgi:gamma-glutamylcyclotransferase (GGCT)/AIG2-like uncharacterized protein YtfP